MTNYTIDSSFLVKGLVPVRRRKRDEVYRQRLRDFQMASHYLALLEKSEARMFIPAIALVEVGAVVSRLTNSPQDAKAAIAFVRSNATEIFYEADILEQAIATAISAKTGGYDTIFITVAQITKSTLLTADRIQYEAAQALGLNSMLLQEMG